MPPLPHPLLAAPGLAKSKVLSKSLFLSPCKTSNNSTPEEISVFLFHELLSQPAASRACCHFWRFITVVILCSHFAFATRAQPPRVYFSTLHPPLEHVEILLSPAPSPPSTAHGLPHPHHFNQSANTGGRSSSRTAILLQLHPSLAEEPEIQEFWLYFQGGVSECRSPSIRESGSWPMGWLRVLCLRYIPDGTQTPLFRTSMCLPVSWEDNTRHLSVLWQEEVFLEPPHQGWPDRAHPLPEPTGAQKWQGWRNNACQ